MEKETVVQDIVVPGEHLPYSLAFAIFGDREPNPALKARFDEEMARADQISRVTDAELDAIIIRELST